MENQFEVLKQQIKDNINRWYPKEENIEYFVINNLCKENEEELINIANNMTEDSRILILMDNGLSVKNISVKEKESENLYTRKEIEELLNKLGLIYRKFYYPLPDNNITNVVLNTLGLQLNFNENITEENIIEQIRLHIDNNTPILLSVNHAALFYSIMYKEVNNDEINHNIVIYGYDDEKELIYIKESSINNEVLDSLCKNKVFSSYKITYDMLINFYSKTKQMIKTFDYNNYCLYYIQKVKNIDMIYLKKKIISQFLEVLINNQDYLLNEINQLLNVGKYDSYYRNEQFRRTHYYSLIPLFDFFE